VVRFESDGTLGGPLRNIARVRAARSRRASSYDRSGGNKDFTWIASGESARLLDVDGPGCVTHVWMTAASTESQYLRKLVLRMWWDGEVASSVEVPLGDFFGIGHAETRNFASLPLCMSPQGGRGFTCYFPMPFATHARVEVLNESRTAARLYYYVDYECYHRLAEDLGRFHAHWRRENPCDGITPAGMDFEVYQYEGTNATGSGNYVILDAEGRGHYVGCHLDIRNLTETRGRNWYGEGDDMIFLDGEPWPPAVHGTGTEDYFNTAWCPQEAFTAPYFGITMPGGPNWAGNISLYRYHVEDPIHFERSIRVTIEHGHANRRRDDYASTAYWYQMEPHKVFPPLHPVAERLLQAEG
jgi:D-arabinan exo alpha-(1,3)/(1,5)-arabinofuranosidase (non-reducing end)